MSTHNPDSTGTTLIVSKDIKVEKVFGQFEPMEKILGENGYISKVFTEDPQLANAQFEAQSIPFKVVQSSAQTCQAETIPASRGFVDTCQRAYNQHHHLTLDPNHVWTAVLTQFALYVEGQGESIRDTFVDFQGKKALEISSGGNLFSADFGQMANRMVDEQIVKNIKDPSITNWLLPRFSTTTPTDRIVASVAIMSALQNFFEYKFSLCCGLPSVTLEGTLQDWKDLRAKLDRLPEFEVKGKDYMKKWYSMLVPIFDNFVKTKEGNGDPLWWNRICSRLGGGSGPSYISGWLSVFAVFGQKGRWQGGTFSVGTWLTKETSKWPIIDTSDLPSGVVTVPVLIDDNGKQYHSKMFTGQFATEVRDHRERVVPRNDWCIVVPQSEL